MTGRVNISIIYLVLSRIESTQINFIRFVSNRSYRLIGFCFHIFVLIRKPNKNPPKLRKSDVVCMIKTFFYSEFEANFLRMDVSYRFRTNSLFVRFAIQDRSGRKKRRLQSVVTQRWRVERFHATDRWSPKFSTFNTLTTSGRRSVETVLIELDLQFKY